MDHQPQSPIDALLPTPTPSTSSLAISQVQIPPPTAQDAFNGVYSVAFSVLWLFGLARNLISYIVSLGIIPLKTASRIFGIEHTQPQPAVLLSTRRKDREERNHGTRYTSVQHVSQPPSADKRGLNGDRKQWLLHETTKPASATSSSSTVGSSIRTNSVPNSPRHTPRSSYSLPPIDASTDTEGVKSRPRYRNSASSRRLERQGELTDEDTLVEADISTGRSRIDHSNRRILFVDSKPSRRQTAPVALISPSTHEVPAWTSVPLSIADSPLQTLVPLADVEASEPRPQSQAKSSPPHSRPVSTNEFGEFVSASPVAAVAAAVGDVDKDAVSGAESSSEKKGKGKEKEKRRSAFKIFGRKRADSITSSSAPLPVDTMPAPPAPSVPVVSASTSKLRRRSPYPAKAGPATPNTRSVGVMAGSVSISDAEVSSSCPASSNTSWLRSRPKRFTKRGRSNSMCSTTGSTIIPPTPSKEPVSILRGSLDTLYFDPNSATPPSTSLSPIAPSPTSQTQLPSPSTPLGRSNTTTATPSKSRFNPFRDLEAHLYNRHGVGTGPGTSVEYAVTPLPKEGIRRTRPYEMFGLERPAPPPGSRTPNGATRTSRDRRERTEVEQREEEDVKRLNAARRVSAPAVSTSKLDAPGRPITPSRAHTQPL